ncbi:MAG TPA: PIN domain-containing protein, partial [Longimicrobiales bacterium]|nr:PIN domain-containing protein [Longimicrobiales bacterium]
MATLLDTSALVVLLRRSPEPARARVAAAAAAELRGSHGLVSAVTLAELLIGARDGAGAERIR